MVETKLSGFGDILKSDMMNRFLERAPGYDKENKFFQEDFDELKESGYLLSAVPKELGGLGMNLAQVSQNQRRIAYYAPATSLAVGMHFYWTGLAADMWNSGDKSLEWMLVDTVAGHVFAAGHAESGNDLPGIMSLQMQKKRKGVIVSQAENLLAA